MGYSLYRLLEKKIALTISINYFFLKLGFQGVATTHCIANCERFNVFFCYDQARICCFSRRTLPLNFGVCVCGA